MAKISDEAREVYAQKIKPYQDDILKSIEKEKSNYCR